jgi:uncharacterized protein YigE (DUF2233 family)
MRRGLIVGLAISLVCACSPIDPAPSTAPPASLVTSIPSSDSISNPTPTPHSTDTGWQTIQAGLEYRELDVTIDGSSDRLRLARLDPSRVRFRVLYEPDQPRRVSQWFASIDSASLVVNGGYFDPEYRALGLLISEGQISGRPYAGFGGMFAVSGADVAVRWNLTQPYVEGEALTYARQNFPMLVIPGGVPNTEIDDNGRTAPRTAVGQDRSGRIVFVVSPGFVFTLTGFGQWLAASDLDLETALNFDGGTSSGLLVRDGNGQRGTDSWVSVPDVIVAEAK